MSRSSRYYCFTLKYQDDFNPDVLCEIADKCDYFIAGLETGSKTGYRHLQGYLILPKPQRPSYVKKLFDDDTIHLEYTKGTPQQAADYCRKEGKVLLEKGLLVEQRPGERTDLESFKEAILSGMTEMELIDNFTCQMARYPKFYQQVRAAQLRKCSQTQREVTVHYIYGPTGSGKTRWAFETFPDLYRLDHANMDGKIWFDGYEGQKTLLIDDFRGGIKCHYLLELLDRYPMQLQIKGSVSYANWTTVIITSNVALEALYQSVDDPTRAALRRRITHITYQPALTFEQSNPSLENVARATTTSPPPLPRGGGVAQTDEYITITD